MTHVATCTVFVSGDQIALLSPGRFLLHPIHPLSKAQLVARKPFRT